MHALVKYIRGDLITVCAWCLTGCQDPGTEFVPFA